MTSFGTQPGRECFTDAPSADTSSNAPSAYPAADDTLTSGVAGK
jgi:hypothetical protein